MKRLKQILLLLLGAIMLVACGSPEAETPAPTVDRESEQAAQDTPPAETDVAQPTATPQPTVPAKLPPPVMTGGDDDAVETTPDEEAAPSAEADEPAAAPAGGVEAWPADRFGYGVQSHAIIGDPAVAMVAVGDQLNMDWVKVQMRWADVQNGLDTYDWGIWDAIVEQAAAHDLHLLFSVVTTPEWLRAAGDQHGPPDDYGEYYRFLELVVTRYLGRVHAIEVWNEQNLDREWQTAQGVAPAPYVDFLKGAYETIKGIDPNMIVISGALAPTGVHDPNKMTVMNDMIWTDEALALGMLDYTDCVGVHHNGYNLPPDVGFDEVERAGSVDEFNFTGPWTNPHESWSFKTTLDLMAQKVQAADPAMQLCVTEFGWATSEGYDEIPATFEFALDNTLEEQGQFIVQAFNQMRESDDVWLAFLFNFDFGNKGRGPTDDVVPYSIIDINGIPRPAFGMIAEMEKQP